MYTEYRIICSDGGDPAHHRYRHVKIISLKVIPKVCGIDLAHLCQLMFMYIKSFSIRDVLNISINWSNINQDC